MDENYSKALTQVNEVLKYTDPTLVSQIPENFKNFISENMSKTYSFTIKKGDTVETILPNLTEEAKSVLAIIYRSYICSPEEKEYLLALERDELIEQEQEQNDTSNVNPPSSNLKLNEIFPQKEEVIPPTKPEINLIETEEKWYIRLLEKLLNKLKGLN